MLEAKVRGHVLQHTARFFRDECDPSIALRVNSAISIELRSLLQEVSPPAWYPRQLQVELLNAAALAHGNDEAAQRDFIRCGAKIALADNHFMKLLTKLLTPELFFRKAERLWDRDNQNSGRLELEAVDAAARSARLRLCDVGGYAHSSAIWLGFMKGILDELSPRGLHIAQHGWSLASPAPDHVVYDVRWS